MNDAGCEATQTASSALHVPPLTTPPKRVGRYVIGEALGAGAMGVVYRARDPQLDREVAIKVVRAGDDSATSGVRLLREAQSMARLRHPNVVPIFDVGPSDGAVFVAMPLLDGGTLGSWLRDRTRPLAAVLDRFVAAGRGLAAAHAAGLVHRDFKPDNVLLGSDGEVRVADFGLARFTQRDVTSELPPTLNSDDASTQTSQHGEVVGTPAYMAPEQLCGIPSDARADQFSFCVALWEGLYGARPFANPAPGTADPLRARLGAIAAGALPPARRDRPAWIAQLLTRGLAPDPAQRWPSMETLLDAIEARRAPRRWPRLVVVGPAAAGVASIALAVVTTAEVQPPRFHPVPLSDRGALDGAAISPDGSQLAYIARGQLIVRAIASESDERVLVDHGIADEPVGWSLDGKQLIVGVDPVIAGQLETEVVDLDSGHTDRVAAVGKAAFLAGGEIAVTEYRKRSVMIFAAGAHTPERACDVPGDYTFVARAIGMPDGTIVVDTVQGGNHALVMLARDCRQRARFAAGPTSSVAATDRGSLVALAAPSGAGEIVEISLDGKVESRRSVTGDLAGVLGRRRGVDYVLTRAPTTRLDRLDRARPDAVQTVRLVNGRASFSLAPDGETLAIVELSNRGRSAGPLWLSAPRELSSWLSAPAVLSRSGRPLLAAAWAAAWSPDGSLLAALVDNEQGAASAPPRADDDTARLHLVVMDRRGNIQWRTPPYPLERAAAPVWLDSQRIAAQTEDRTTYRWFDRRTGLQGDLVDRSTGSTYWLTRSPRDGTLAMWRMGNPGNIDLDIKHLWLMSPGLAPRPLHVAKVLGHFAMPSWSPSGELLVRVLETGEVARVALDTGRLTPIAQLPRTQMGDVSDDHLMMLSGGGAGHGGDLLAVDVDLGLHVAAMRLDEPSYSAVGSPPL